MLQIGVELARRAVGVGRAQGSKRGSRRWIAALLGVALALAGWSSAARAETIHVIRSGESLAAIAKQHDVDMAALAAYNNITDPNLIVIGQQLTLPPRQSSLGDVASAADAPLPGEAGYHVVARGESLSAIARQYDLALSDLLRLNGLADANRIWVGQTLRLTARVAPVTAGQPAAPDLADTIYVVQEGDTLAFIAKAHNSSVEQLMQANGLPNSGFIYTGQRLRIKQAAAPTPDNVFGVAGAPPDGRRWIQIDLSEQTLTAWQGDVAVLRTTISSGKAATPTVVGTFAIQTKYESQDMQGDDYFLPGVPWVMYFHEGFAIHGAYWHANFGNPTSHGCINMRIPEAEALFHWADIGTQVVVQE